jgi:hypothetical protein
MKWSLVCLTSLLFPTSIRAQALGGAWVDKGGVCMEFHPTSDLLMLDPISWYAGWRNGGQRFEYARRKDLLIIKHFHNQVMPLWFEKEQCVFKIDTLTSTVLQLTLVSEKDGGAILETIGGKKVIFHRIPVGCMVQLGIPEGE